MSRTVLRELADAVRYLSVLAHDQHAMFRQAERGAAGFRRCPDMRCERLVELLERARPRCSFCLKMDVRKLVEGPDDVAICDECVDLCSLIIATAPPPKRTRRRRARKPVSRGRDIAT